MSDLISRKHLINFWRDIQRECGNLASINSFIESIKRMPTACELDKVVKKITEKQLSVQEKFYSVEGEEFAVMLRGQLRGIADCLEIIKEERQ